MHCKAAGTERGSTAAAGTTGLPCCSRMGTISVPLTQAREIWQANLDLANTAVVHPMYVWCSVDSDWGTTIFRLWSKLARQT